MNDLHKITGWLRGQAMPQPGLTADQPPGAYDPEARNGPLPRLKEEAIHGKRRSGPPS